MTKVIVRTFAVVLSLFIAGQCVAQDVSLSFEGLGAVAGACGATVEGAAGDPIGGDFGCVLSTENNGLDEGAQGWSISVAAEGAVINSITTDGTVGADVAQGGMRSVGFEKSETTIRSGVTPGGGNGCEGLDGAVSAVVLSFVNPITLDPNGSETIAIINVSANFPGAEGESSTATILFADGCRGAGQPVRNAVTLNAQTIIPSLGSCVVTLSVPEPPSEDCGAVGDEDGNGLADCLDPACDPCPAGESSFDLAGCSDVTGEAGTAYSQEVEATLTTDQPGDGAQGWSISIAADGTTISAITTDGTVGADVANGGLRSVGFEKSETTDRDGDTNRGNDCGGLNGAVSAVVLSFTTPVTLPGVGTAAIAVLTVTGDLPADEETCSTGTLAFANGCRGVGQPVVNAMTLGGETIYPTLSSCSFQACSEAAPPPPPEVCEADFTLGFSGANGAIPIGISGTDFAQDVDCTLTTANNNCENEGVGAQGWSFGVTGTGFEITGITTDGTAAEDASDLGFDFSEFTADGAIMVTILGFQQFIMLPASGVSTVARVSVATAFPDAATETKTLQYANGLVGSGLAVKNIVAFADTDVDPASTGYELTITGVDNNYVSMDFDGSGQVNIADLQALLNWLYLGGDAPACRDAMDFNGNDRINVADAVSGLNYLFAHTSASPAAGVGCQVYLECGLNTACE